MLSSNSTWDRGAAKKPLSPAFVKGASRVVYEFENRRSEKIFAHRLGRIDFRPGLGDALSTGRNEQIEAVYGDRSVDGYRYKAVSHVHVRPVLIGSDLTILGHGIPVASGWENCAMAGATCAEGESDTRCEVGKCRIGTLTRMVGDRWRYDSLTVPGLYYFVFGTESVTLRSVTRGRFSLPAGAGTVSVSRVASVPATIYLPPNTYSAETFTRRVITTRYAGTDTVRSLTDSVDTFIRSLLGLNQATVRVEIEVRDRLLDALRSVLDPAWYGFVGEAVDEIWRSRFTGTNMTNREFLVATYEALTGLYGSGVEVMMSGIRPSTVGIDDKIGRPVYGRLPGVEGAYNDGSNANKRQGTYVKTGNIVTVSLPNHNFRTGVNIELDYSNGTATSGNYQIQVIDPNSFRVTDQGFEDSQGSVSVYISPAKWLTAGADDVLSGTKHMLDNFYRTYLDPETCYPLNLDWLAQHLGFVGGLWNLEWPNATKRLLLRNAHVNAVSGSMWTRDPELDTLRRIDTGRIERVEVDPGTGTVSTAYRYSGRTYDPDTELTTIETFNGLVADVTRWQGILPSRGSLLTLLFMFWALGIKAHSPEELRYDPVTGTFVVRSGLRDRELNAPVNVPYMVDVLRVGSDTDAEVNNYPNQLIADVGTCQDELSANTTVIRMPFYYNRNGRTWDAALSVMVNYAPNTSINRVQYAYAAADLLVADDVFFEPEVVAS